MATKKAASTKKATVKKPAAAKTTVRTVRADAKPASVKPVTAGASTSGSKVQLPSNIINIVLAELFGTFILTLVALAATQDANALYVGIALALLVVAVGAISGAHVNPAVTFGLWTMRKLKTVLVPIYWIAQFIGAMLAVIVSNWVANSSISLSFSDFAKFDWSVFGVELVATAVFLFGLAAVISRRELSTGARAAGIGASLAIGLVVGGTLLTALKAQDVATYQKQYQANQSSGEKATNPEIPHSAFVKGVTANPAVALAVTDNAENTLDSSSSNDKTNSRFTLEVILGTLVGAALGGNLYLLIAGRRNND